MCLYPLTKKKIKGYNKINDFASKLLSEANLYDGYCKGIDYGDKGGTALVVFGAPTSYEDTAIRACLFILSLKQEFRRKIRAGIAFGSVYAGLIGNHFRFGYDVLGDTVNLSARLMSEVKFGKIWISERAVFELRGKFTTDLLGRMILKGKATQEKVYELLSKKEIPQEKL